MNHTMTVKKIYFRYKKIPADVILTATRYERSCVLPLLKIKKKREWGLVAEKDMEKIH